MSNMNYFSFSFVKNFTYSFHVVETHMVISIMWIICIALVFSTLWKLSAFLRQNYVNFITVTIHILIGTFLQFVFQNGRKKLTL